MKRASFASAPGDLEIRLSGEIDHHSARALQGRLDREFARSQPSRVILDFRDVQFMDSAGIGLLLGRYRRLKAKGASLCVKNVGRQVDKVFQVAGLYQVIKKWQER